MNVNEGKLKKKCKDSILLLIRPVFIADDARMRDIISFLLMFTTVILICLYNIAKQNHVEHPCIKGDSNPPEKTENHF